MRKPFIAVAVFILALTTLVMAADDPFAGTWKLNVEKSQAGVFPAWKSGTVKIEIQEDGLKYSADFVYEQAPILHTDYFAKYDGKDYPATGSSYFDTVSLKKINASTMEYVWKKDGKETARWQCVVSGNGRIVTVTMNTIYQARSYNQMMVLEKQ